MDRPEKHFPTCVPMQQRYNRLPGEVQRLFRSLGVFVDGWTSEAATAVCAAPEGATPLSVDIAQGLHQLVQQELIFQHRSCTEGDEPRYGMAESARSFALAQLRSPAVDRRVFRERGTRHTARDTQAEALRRAHAHYFRDFAERAQRELCGPQESAWQHIANRELGNLQAALGWAIETGAVALGLRLATALWRFWLDGGYLQEGQQWIETLVSLADGEGQYPPTPLPTWLRARAMATAGMLAGVHLDFAHAHAYADAGLALGRESGDVRAVMLGLLMLAGVSQFQGDLEGATAHVQESLTIAHANAQPLFIQTGLAFLARIAVQGGDLEAAKRLFTEAWAVSRPAGLTYLNGLAMLELGEIALQQREERHAATLFREAAATFRASGRVSPLLDALTMLGVACARLGYTERAARLLGAAECLRQSTKIPYVSIEQLRYTAAAAPLRLEFLDGLWAPAFAAGHRLSLEEACAEAAATSELSDELAQQAATTRHTTRASAADTWALTARELEVLRLLARGWTDAQIAERLSISRRTVNHHTSALYSKLDVSSRTAAARYALEHHLL